MVDELFQKKVAKVCGKIGQILIASGAEIPRVERTVEYIGRAAEVDISCYATLNAVFIDSGEETGAHFVKVKVGGFNLQKVDEINHLSRSYYEGEISFDELSKRVDSVANQVIDFPWKYKLLGAGLVSVTPMMVFNASYMDLFLSFLIGMMGYSASHAVEKRTNIPYIKEAVSSFIVSGLALIITLIGVGTNSSSITLCALMPLVPGIAITNSLREIIDRHIIAGIMRGVDAVLTAGAIGSGVVIATSVINSIRVFFEGV